MASFLGLGGCASSNHRLEHQVRILEKIDRSQDEDIRGLKILAASNEYLDSDSRTRILNLETEIKRLRKVLCDKNPGDCPASVIRD